jgi:hypothetical protein
MRKKLMKIEKFAGSLPCRDENFQNKKFFNFWISNVFAHSGSEPRIFFIFCLFSLMLSLSYGSSPIIIPVHCVDINVIAFYKFA